MRHACVVLFFLAALFLPASAQERLNPSIPSFEGREVSDQLILTLTEPMYEEITARFGRKDLGSEVSTILPNVAELRWILPQLPPQGSEEWRDMTEVARLAVIKLAPTLVPSPAESKKQKQARFAAAQNFLERYAAKPGSVQPDRIVELAQFNDPLLPGQLNYLYQTSTNMTWDTSFVNAIPNKRLALVVIDSGVNCSHVDLLVDTANSKGFGNDQPCEDLVTHGTLVAAVAAAKANNGFAGIGVAANFPIISFRIFQRICSTDGKECITGATESDAARAFLATASLPYDLVVANASFKLDGDSALWKQVVSFVKRKVLIVAAAGNDAADNGLNPTYPCSFSLEMENVICVGATSNFEEFAEFSNRGKGIDIAAPGDGVLTTLIDQKPLYASGTSFSAPFVSGAAIVAANNTNKLLSPAELKQALLVGARFNPMLVGFIPKPRQLSVLGTILAAQRIANGETLAEKSATPPSILGIKSIFGQDPNSAAPAEWVEVYGEGFATASTSATSPTPQLGKMMVWFGAAPALLGFTGPAQINGIAPPLFTYPPKIFNRIVVAKLDESGSPIMDSATSLKFNGVNLNPGIVGLIRADGSFVGEDNPARAKETLTLVASGVHLAKQLVLSIDGQVAKATVQDKWETGVTTLTFQMPESPGPYSVMVSLMADKQTIDRGFNFTP